MTSASIDSHTRDALAGIGERLRAAREAASLSVEDVAQQLKMPAHVVRALEAEDWARLGAPVFVRGQVRSYSRLLGLSTGTMMDALSMVGPVQPTDVVSKTHIPATHWWADQIGRRLAYVAITAALAIPVWLAARQHLNGGPVVAESLEAPVAAPEGVTAPPVAAPPRRTVVASITPPVVAAPAVQELIVRTSGESWIEVRGMDGKLIEQGLLANGQERRWPVAQVASAKFGNASTLQVTRNGEQVDLTPFTRAEVVRFTVSSDGSLSPVR